MTNYLNGKDIGEAVSAAMEMKAPKYFLSEMLNKMIVFTLERSDEDRENTSKLIHALSTEGLVSRESLLPVSLLSNLKGLIIQPNVEG